MADCNSIESLLNELLGKLDDGGDGCCEELRPVIFQIQKDVLGLKDASRLQRIKLERLIKEFINFKKSQITDKTISGRLKRAELQIKAQIAFTAKLNTFAKKTDNDFRFFLKRWSIKLAEWDKKNIDQDEKIKKIDEQLTAIKIALALLTGAGGALAVFTAKLAALVAKGKVVDTAIDSIKRLVQRGGQKGDKGDKGDRGFKGDQGDQGQTGSKGDIGQKGDQGEAGSKGDKGEQGEAGSKGDKGDQGEAGSKGDKGDQGEAGSKGDKGDQGEAGSKGDKGDKGDKGEDAEVQIVETEKVVYKEPEYESCVIKKFDKCDLTNNEPLFIYETIQVIKGHGVATQKLFEQVADIEALQCKPSEAIAAIPEYWAVRPMADRPQLVVMFGEVLPNGKFGSAKYPICIPHYIGSRGNKPVLPNYQKGQIEGKLTLKDNSKLIVNAVSESEAQRIIDVIKSYINPLMINSDKVQFTNRKGEELAKITVAPRNLRYFSTGQKSSTPDYIDLY